MRSQTNELPLFPDERDIALLVLGPDRAKHWPAIAKALETRGFPRIHPLMGGRKLDDVLHYFESESVKRGSYPSQMFASRNFTYAPYAPDGPETPPGAPQNSISSSHPYWTERF